MALSFFQRIQQRDRNFSIEIDGQDMPVHVSVNERAKRLTLRIAPNGETLKVTTPSHVGDDEIEAFVRRNRNWVAARISRLPKKTEIEDGAVIPFKGIDHLIVHNDSLRGLVSVDNADDRNRIIVPGERSGMSRKLLAWLKREARREIDVAVVQHANALGVRPKRIRITDTTSRWGSCSSTRTLSFSWRIIMAPPEVLDYLVAHEVAHLVEMNHSDRFWALTKRLCPDMDRHKAWLRQHGNKLHSINVD